MDNMDNTICFQYSLDSARIFHLLIDALPNMGHTSKVPCCSYHLPILGQFATGVFKRP